MDESLSPEKILYRLEELRRWQRIQEQRLLEQQMCQRRTLTKEQLQVFRHHNNRTIDSLDVSKENDEPLEYCTHSVDIWSGGIETVLSKRTCRAEPQDGHGPMETRSGDFPTELVMVNSNGEQTLRFPNGQTEIHTHDHKRREFPDGTVKVVYADGVVETRYGNGRIRVKDKQGNLVMDSAVRSNPVSR